MPPSTHAREPLQQASGAAAPEARAWPFEEARKIVKRLEKAKQRAGAPVIF
jgi:hypothetical protein